MLVLRHGTPIVAMHDSDEEMDTEGAKCGPKLRTLPDDEIEGAWQIACCLEMIMIDDEICGAVFRAFGGIGVDENRLVIDIIDKVRHTGSLLAQTHAMRYLKMGEPSESPLFDKRSAERIKQEGSKLLQTRAKEAAIKILKEPTPMPLERDVEKELS